VVQRAGATSSSTIGARRPDQASYFGEQGCGLKQESTIGGKPKPDIKPQCHTALVGSTHVKHSRTFASNARGLKGLLM
jgi:hypothetical protein